MQPLVQKVVTERSLCDLHSECVSACTDEAVGSYNLDIFGEGGVFTIGLDAGDNTTSYLKFLGIAPAVFFACFYIETIHFSCLGVGVGVVSVKYPGVSVRNNDGCVAIRYTSRSFCNTLGIGFNTDTGISGGVGRCAGNEAGHLNERRHSAEGDGKAGS